MDPPIKLRQPKSLVLKFYQDLPKYEFTMQECSIIWIQVAVTNVGMTCGTVGGEMGKKHMSK